MKRVERKQYLDKLKAFKDHEIIKVVTGIRRSGKSTLLMQFQEYLHSIGIEDKQIVSINFEDFDFIDITDSRKLYEYIKPLLIEGKPMYLFFDEIQHVSDFQRLIDSLYIKPNIDIYITGSNAQILSGELATLLSGRYVEISILPLSFKEYMEALEASIDGRDRYFAQYRQNGGFPYVTRFGNDRQSIHDYISGIFDTVILKDIVARRGFTDVMMLQSVIRFVYDNIGNILSTKKIADTMTSDGRKIDVKTVERYLQALLDCFVVYKAKRYDIKGKQFLRTLDKYYAVDLGIRNFLFGSRHRDMGHELENIVYLELVRRGYDVYIGKYDTLEVDFVAISDMGPIYFQVSETVREKSTLARELSPLKHIDDSYTKILLTMDIDPPIDHNGIRQINVVDWLLGDI